MKADEWEMKKLKIGKAGGCPAYVDSCPVEVKERLNHRQKLLLNVAYANLVVPRPKAWQGTKRKEHDQ